MFTPRKISVTNYYRNIAAKAWNDAMALISDRFVLAITIAILGFIVDISVRGWPTASGEAVVFLLWYVIPIAIIVLVVFGWYFVLAPARMLEAECNQRLQAEDDKLELQSRIKPKLAFVVGGSGAPWRQVQPSQNPTLQFSDPGLLYTYRIGILNRGTEKAANVEVRVAEIVPRPENLLVVPCALQFMNSFDDFHDIPTTTESDPRFIDVVTYFKGQGDWMGLCHVVAHGDKTLPIQSYRIRLVATADNGGEQISQWIQIGVTEAIPELTAVDGAFSVPTAPTPLPQSTHTV